MPSASDVVPRRPPTERWRRHRRRARILVAAACVSQLVDVASGDSLRNALLSAAAERVNLWYADTRNLEDAKQSNGVTFRLSKEDKACGGDGVPLTFVEYDVDGVRPIDVFNVLADTLNQTSWDPTVSKMDFLGDMEPLQARGFAGVFGAHGAPVPDREIFEWQFAKANATEEEFWVVFSSIQNDELRQKEPMQKGAVEMQNCMAAYKVSKTAKGAHVVNTQQVNSHPWPLSARYVANAGFSSAVDFAQALRQKSAEQAGKGWNSTRTTAPHWMLEDRPCGAQPPEVELKTSILRRANSALASRDGTESQKALPGGETLRIWRRSQECGGCGVPSASIPSWRAEFRIMNASPTEVFNVLVAKGGEAGWNSRALRANFTGFRSGARGVHEEFQSPRTAFHTWRPRELWEWQVADHIVENRTYLVALASENSPETQPFDKEAVTAAQCMAAFAMSPLPDGADGTLVALSQHINPNVGAVAALSFLWISEGERLLVDFAAALAAQAAQMRGRRRTRGAALGIDGDALALLAPQPPGRNDSLSLAQVLAVASNNDALLRGFGALNLPHVLAGSAGPTDMRAKDLLRLYTALERNATAEERMAFAAGLAEDDLALQSQGEAMAAMQWRVVQELARRDCAGNIPDFNKDKKSGGLSIELLVGIGVAVLLILVAGVASCLCRWRRKRRQRRDMAAAAALLETTTRAAEAVGQSCEA